MLRPEKFQANPRPVGHHLELRRANKKEMFRAKGMYVQSSQGEIKRRLICLDLEWSV